ncbi:MAG: tyrosine-protein kinase family protein, partial [Prevotella sp.]
ITRLKETYDYIILDTAPVGLVSDSIQIAKVADITVIVCRADYTPRGSFELFNNLHAEHKLPNMCYVLNGVDMSKKKYGYYYGYGKYGHYGRYASYGGYSYGNYSNSHYSNKEDKSIKL